MDDLVTGADSLEETLSVKGDGSSLLKEGKFEHLRKWSNLPCFQDTLIK